MLAPLASTLTLLLLAGGAEAAPDGCGAPALWTNAASAPDAITLQKIDRWLTRDSALCRLVADARAKVPKSATPQVLAAQAERLASTDAMGPARIALALLQGEWFLRARLPDRGLAALDKAPRPTGNATLKAALRERIAFARADLLLGRAALAAAGQPRIDAFGAALAHIDAELPKKGDAVPRVLLARHRALTGLERGHEAHVVADTLLSAHAASAEARSLEPHGPLLELSRDALVRRVQVLIGASRMKRAADDALAAKRGGRVDAELEALTVTALVRAGRISDALDRAEKFQQREPDDDVLLKALAWALAKANRKADASERYFRLAQRTSERTGPRNAAGEACFLSAFLLFEDAFDAAGYDAARAQFANCSDMLVGHHREASALWYRALMNLLQARYGAAAVDLQKLIEKHPGDPEALKHQFWLAQALAASGHHKTARPLYLAVMRDAPVHYYGMMARRALGASAPGGPTLSVAAQPADNLLAKLPADAATRRAALLFALGFPQLAQAAGDPGKTVTLATLARAQLVGNFFRGYRNGPRVLRTRANADGQLKKTLAWRAPYARPRSALVARAAKDAGLDTSMAYAIMRTESGFLEDAVSVAGAVGLMQLMPYTARGMAKKAGLPPPSFEAVADPTNVVTLGTLFLATSEREFGSKLLSAACYNAGPQNVAPWLSKLAGTDPVMFIERIPYRETRNYVKKVLATEALYRALDKGGAVDLRLPAGKIPPAPPAYTWFPPDDNG